MAGFNPFGSVPVAKKGRTNFNESFELSGTFPLSKVCPVMFIDSLPGSSWRINAYNLTKLETLIAPAMQRVNASILWFKMPKRLLFKNFKKWYSGGEDGEDQSQKPHIFLMKFAEQVCAVIDLTLSNVAYRAEAKVRITNMLFGPGTLWNYMGLPVPLQYSSNQWRVKPMTIWDFTNYDHDTAKDSDFVDCMPFMAYNFLYDTYFMDQTLNDKIFVEGEEQDFTINRGYYSETFVAGVPTCRLYVGPQSKYQSQSGIVDLKFFTSGNLYEGGELSASNFLALLFLFNRAWKKDYFTSALPTPQRGPEVKVPLSGSAPVSQSSVVSALVGEDPSISALGGDALKFGFGYNVGADSTLKANDEGLVSRVVAASSGNPLMDSVSGGNISVDNPQFVDANGDPVSNPFIADLSNVSPIAITALRNLFKLQSFLEKNNVSGGRYIETILAHWAERVPDFTVQRPQFIRATTIPVQISEVTATANSSGTSSVVGDQAGRARTQGNLGHVRIYTQEPSFIFGLYCVTAPPAYAGQGIPKIFQHVTRFDEPWPDFQHIGEQAVKLREIYFPFGDATALDQDFGYQQRYSEYKYMPDRVVGNFQTSMAYWHMARMFNNAPALNGDFVTQNLDPRIFAVQTGHPVTASFYFEATAKLKLSKYSTPKIS